MSSAALTHGRRVGGDSKHLPSRQQHHDGHLMVLAGMSSVTEEEVERAFQQAVHGSSVPEAVSPGVQLATAIHDTEIDRLLQKLVCGEVEYNPHDPSRHAHPQTLPCKAAAMWSPPCMIDTKTYLVCTST